MAWEGEFRAKLLNIRNDWCIFFSFVGGQDGGAEGACHGLVAWFWDSSTAVQVVYYVGALVCLIPGFYCVHLFLAQL